MLKGKLSCNGALISYRTIGSGSDVILVHGMATNHAFWRLSLLLALARDHRVTVFDMRGHGNSSAPPQGYTTKDLAEDVKCLCDQLQIREAHFIGHSMGGAVALHFAILYPRMVKSLTIADSRVRSIQPANYARDWPLWENARKKLGEVSLLIPEEEPEAGFWLLEQMAKPESFSLRDNLQGSSLACLFGSWSGGRRTAKNWLHILETTTARKDFLRCPDLPVEQLANLHLPVLALYGALSSSLPTLSGLKRLLPQCRTEVLAGAGHFFPFTQVERFTEATCTFLSETEGVP